MIDILGKAILGSSAGKVIEVAGKIVDKVVDEVTDEVEVSNYTSKVTEEAIAILLAVHGIGQAHSRDFKRSMPVFSLTDGTVVKIYQNPVKIEHVFLADTQGQMIYGGYVDWSSSSKLKQAIEEIRAFLAP